MTTKTLTPFEHAYDWHTEKLVRFDDQPDLLYLIRGNGGTQGSYDDRQFTGAAEAVSLTEARAIALGWDYEPAEVAELTGRPEPSA